MAKEKDQLKLLDQHQQLKTMEAIKYWRKEGNIGWSREEPYDPDYGTPKKPVRADYKLAILDTEAPQGFLEGLALFNKLEQMTPAFSSLIPPLPKLPPKTIPSDTYLWVSYVPGVVPAEFGEYEGGLELDNGSYQIIRLQYYAEADLEHWIALYNLGLITFYRKRNVNNDPLYLPNPLYQPAKDQQDIELVQLEILLKETLIITATHIFPTIPLNTILIANLISKYGLSGPEDINPDWLWKWARLNGTTWENVEVDPNFWLAVPGPSGGFLGFRKPIRPNPNLLTWKTAAARAVGDYTPQQKLKRILQIP